MVALLHELFPWALLFFVANSVVRAHGRGWLLLSWRGEPHAACRDGVWLAGLSPLCEVVRLEEPRMWLGTDALYLARHDAPANRFTAPADMVPLAWSAVALARCAGRKVVVGDGVWRAHSPQEAEAMATRLREWAMLAPDRRSRQVADWIAQRRSLPLVREQRARQAPGLFRLRGATTGCFAAGFVALPLALYAGEQPSALALLFLLLAAGAAAAAARVAWTMLAACGVTGAGRRRALEPLAFYPPLAAHAASFATREVYTDFAPCAVAAALGTPAAARACALEEWLEIEIGRSWTTTPDLAGYWAARTSALEALLREADLGSKERLLERPRQDPRARAFCPGCDAEYREPRPACGECDLPLRQWEPAPD